MCLASSESTCTSKPRAVASVRIGTFTARIFPVSRRSPRRRAPSIRSPNRELTRLAPVVGCGYVARDRDDRFLARRVVERHQRHFPSVVDLRELLHQPWRELRQMLHEAHVATLFGKSVEKRAVHGRIGGPDRANPNRAAVTQRQRCFEFWRIGVDRHRVGLMRDSRRTDCTARGVSDVILRQRPPTLCRPSAIIGAESAFGPVAQLVRAEDS